MTAALLSFDTVSENSLDAVSDRDFALEFLFCCSAVFVHLSRLCEELVYFSSAEFAFLEFSDAFSTGSSMMPQKKNPDMAELIRGKSGRVFGNLFALLTVLKGLPLAYNKDMQEDKEPVFDSAETVKSSLSILIKMLPEIRFCTDNMKKAALSGCLNATDMADYLVKKGLPFRSAHEVTGKIVLYAVKNKARLEELPLEKLREFSPLFEKDVAGAIKLKSLINGRASVGGPAPKEVKRQIRKIRKNLKK
jgi:argininosuccinate lyase